MTGRRKASLKRFIIRWELWWYGLTIALYLAALGLVVVVFPDVSNLWVSIFVLVGSFTAAVSAAASAIKSNDTEE